MNHSNQSSIRQWIRDTIDLRESLLSDNRFLDAVDQGGRMIIDCISSHGKILLCGNGGSAADAQHIAAELVVRYKASNERRALPAIALTTDSSLLTACANDFTFDQVFSRQIEALGQPGDLLIAISTSGNSSNVNEAVKVAQSKQMAIIQMLGGDGGKMAANFNGAATPMGLILIVPSSVTARIQEVHITIGHIWCELIDQVLFGFA